MLQGQLVTHFSIVWPDIHGPITVEVVNELDDVFILFDKVSHGPRLRLGERMSTRERLGARVVFRHPLETVVSVDVNAHLHIAAVNAISLLLSAVHVLAL